MSTHPFIAKAQLLYPEFIKIRRHLHAHPELSFQEEKTSQFICDFLSSHHIPFTTGWAGTGIVATFEGRSERRIGLRADMDALPIEEQTGSSFASIHAGIMHACGHDMHMACLMGAALILSSIERPYHINMLFQPGEEKLPGGASLMIREGVLNNLDAIIGLHVFPELPAGHLGFRKGAYMASSDEIFITVHGKGGHAALPHLIQDPVVGASKLILAFQNITKNFAPKNSPSVLAFGKVVAPGATNVIPDNVMLEGTLRTMDESWRMEAHQLIQQIADDTLKESGLTSEVVIKKGYPVLINHPEFTSDCQHLSKNIAGSHQIHDLDIRMTAEDFAYYTQQIPGCFFRLGTGNANYPVHSSRFNPDENALITGAATLAYLATHVSLPV
ncbi:MAG: amidohydrolase [Candidatus Competibacteraceae bacterium]|nr:amidohydrolase [Candidatus Competibacteraceae bacterium]